MTVRFPVTVRSPPMLPVPDVVIVVNDGVDVTPIVTLPVADDRVIFEPATADAT